MPRALLFSALLAGLAALAAGCDGGPERSFPTYGLTLQDEGGALVATGELYLDDPIAPNTTVSGTYELDRDIGVSQAGRFEATCAGGPTTDDDRLTIELGIGPDAGLLLEGGCVSGVRGGVWSQYTIGGPVPQGTFDLSGIFFAF